MPRISARTGRGTRVSMSYSAWVVCAILAMPVVLAVLAVYLAYVTLRAVVWCIAWLIARSRR